MAALPPVPAGHQPARLGVDVNHVPVEVGQ
jgi:hypothetical protein